MVMAGGMRQQYASDVAQQRERSVLANGSDQQTGAEMPSLRTRIQDYAIGVDALSYTRLEFTSTNNVPYFNEIARLTACLNADGSRH